MANLILNRSNAPLRSWGFPPLAIASRQGTVGHTETWVIDPLRLGRGDLYFSWLRPG
ncbi:MAG: hypothetical protein F6K56_32825 [Moorea sp. SIO3G5]|nr:hypothetical protein [Moorena sp. SIO3G5]